MAEKDLFWSEKVLKLAGNYKMFSKKERTQFSIDAKALLCRGLKEDEIQQIKRGMRLEEGFFWMSRAYVPLRLVGLYRRGIFGESFSFLEVKYIFRLVIAMHMIDLTGHALFRYLATPVIDRHVGLNEEEFALKKKQTLDDYLVQKNYFKEKKNNKL